MPQPRDNVRAGLFVLLGIVLALLAVFLLADFGVWFQKKQTVTVSYSVGDGIKGLKVGSEVTLGDERVGEVLAIEEMPDAQGRIREIHVAFELPRDVRIHQNAVIEVKAPPIGSGAKLNIRSVGEGAEFQPGQIIVGAVSTSEITRSLVADMGIGEKQKEQLRAIFANVEAITATLKTDLPEIAASVKRILADAEPMVKDARAALADGKAALADARAAVADARATVERLSGLVKDKEPALRESLDNVRAATADAKAVLARVREQTMEQVTAALEKADASLENVKKSTESLRALAVGQRPVIERAIANAQLTADQLKLAAVELRRSPWRLLYRPSDEELETDNLYDAARSFAQAAGALDSAAAGLRAVKEQDPANADALKQMLDHLEKLFVEYEKAEKAFHEALKEQSE